MGEVTWLSTLQLALRALQRNRVRTMLTTIGVIVGVASVIAMLSIAAGSQQRVAEELQKLGTNNVTVRAGSATRSGVRTWIGTATRLTLADALAVREIPGVTAVAPLLGRPQQIRYRAANWATEVAGVTPAYLRVSAWDLEAGEFLTDCWDIP
jgi:putative ABC transport system permease protein